MDAHRTFATFARLAARIEHDSWDFDHHSSRHIAYPRGMVGDGLNIQGVHDRLTCHLLQRELLDPCRRISMGAGGDRL